MRNPYLRVKLKSLAEEARIIRLEEIRAKKNCNFQLINELNWHRTYKVRKAARETLLAYQFIREIPYESIERPESKPVDWSAVLKMVKRYGSGKVHIEDLIAWTQPKKKAA